MPEPISDQRRAHVRRLLKVEASLSDNASPHVWRAQLIDIARMGVGFVTSEVLPEEGHFVLDFRFPDSDIHDKVEIVIVYRRAIGTEGRYHYGARIHAMTQDCVDRIVEYVTRAEPHNGQLR
ncbi:PilZ domain-containing protein [Pseudoduganella albidiflava]|uniref:PilZ domain-containing protein n=1 Tax=Pseudoduganella albidiflava TaxID=321983 RepID=A0AA87XTN9_9BURK|nr:PilZ domain-containing protein [Pseudoduganella albidiflava]GGY48889.1 hypothetical protein GCM10007387_33950 [Pseudoduganella albidiflava]